MLGKVDLAHTARPQQPVNRVPGKHISGIHTDAEASMN